MKSETTYPMREPEKMEVCALYRPDKEGGRRSYETDVIIYNLFVCAGRPSDKVQEAESRPFVGLGFYHGGYGFRYVPEFEGEHVAWEVPRWAITLAEDIRKIVRDAESIGYEKGSDHGLSAGKSFVKQLAAGEVSLDDFERADFRMDRRLNRKEW